MDRYDATFAQILEGTLQVTLYGDNDKVPGLYRALHSAPSWDAFNRAAGEITGYENVLREIKLIRARMNGEEIAPRVRPN